MNDNAFKTFHDKDYAKGKFLYHYSRFDTATKIIYNNNLRFSRIYDLNDTTEAKPKIEFFKEDKKNPKIYERCQEINQHIKICCFTQDNEDMPPFDKNNDLYYIDYSGRGFAFPRMWAQYADDNKGVCFIFDKDKLKEAVEKNMKILGAMPIEYVYRYSCFPFDEKTIETFNNQILARTISDSITIEKFLETYPNYIECNYFTKLSDWRDEHEYRIALLSPCGENLTINSMSEFLEGIIVGENIDAVEMTIIQKLLKKKVPVKQIKFQHKSIILK